MLPNKTPLCSVQSHSHAGPPEAKIIFGGPTSHQILCHPPQGAETGQYAESSVAHLQNGAGQRYMCTYILGHQDSQTGLRSFKWDVPLCTGSGLRVEWPHSLSTGMWKSVSGKREDWCGTLLHSFSNSSSPALPYPPSLPPSPPLPSLPPPPSPALPPPSSLLPSLPSLSHPPCLPPPSHLPPLLLPSSYLGLSITNKGVKPVKATTGVGGQTMEVPPLWEGKECHITQERQMYKGQGVCHKKFRGRVS